MSLPFVPGKESGKNALANSLILSTQRLPCIVQGWMSKAIGSDQAAGSTFSILSCGLEGRGGKAQDGVQSFVCLLSCELPTLILPYIDPLEILQNCSSCLAGISPGFLYHSNFSICTAGASTSLASDPRKPVFFCECT